MNPDKPYGGELANATLLSSQDEKMARPNVPDGKATQQAAGSRDQILQDREAGGRSVLVDEAEEEVEARKTVKRSTPRRTRGSSNPQAGSLKNLRERVNGSLQGRSGGMLGVESSR